MVIDNDGNLKVNGSNVILSSGTIQRRPHPDSNTGFQVSPSGFVIVGQTSITNEGVITSSNATISNLTACNLTTPLINLNGTTITRSNYTLSTPSILTMSNTTLALTNGNARDVNTTAATLSNNTPLIHYPLITNYFSSPLTNGTRTCIGFGSVALDATQTAGAAITHERTGAFSIGRLHFSTKSNTTCDIRMTINEWGNVGIGIQTPSNALEVVGTTRSTIFNENGDLLSVKYALSNSASNINSNVAKLSNHFWTFSNTMSNSTSNINSNIATLSNALSNCCFTGSAHMATVSNWTDATFRKKISKCAVE
jgi:hypothetical protein